MKRHLTATQWFAIVLLLVSSVRIGLAQKFVCPKNCSCAEDGPNDYEVSCPEGSDRQIAVQLTSKSKAIIQCQVNTTPEDYQLLRDVFIEADTLLEFRLCPLPDTPFTDHLQLRNAAKIQSFTFSSYRKLNDTLERRLFKGLTGITSLSLANNGLTALPSNLFMDMPHLQQVYLLNNLVQLPADLFQPVLGLETIELGKNELTALPLDVFRNLKKLHLLNLWKNKLQNLSPEMFRDLTSLAALDLRHNGLTSLPNDIFKYLTSLKNIRLDGNEFQILPNDLFKTNKGLVVVQMSDSRKPNLKLPDGLFSNLPNLTTVDLNNLGLKEIPEDIFWGSSKLTSISMQNNRLKDLPNQVFRNASDLEKLNLGFNHINSLSDQIFEQCKKLRFLDLSFNKIINLTKNSLFAQEYLEELYLQNNMLQHIDFSTLPKNCNLKFINLSNNKLSFIETEEFPSLFLDNSPLLNCVKLEKIDLFNNSITYIFNDWRFLMSNLKVLNLSHNALQYIDFHADAFTPNHDREIDVRHNKISVVNLADAESWAALHIQYANLGLRQKWLLDGNPLFCNCSNYDFLRYFERKVAPELIGLVEFVPGKLACAGPEKWIDQPIDKVPSKAVTCPLHQPSFCPHSCSCEFRLADTAIIVDCIQKNLTEAPSELPTSDKSNHTELYLTNNKLRVMPDFNWPGYQNVSKIALGHNNITSLKNVTRIPQIMQVIELHHNNLTVIEAEVMQVFSNLTNLTSISLYGNPWKCECQLQPVVTFVQVSYQKISNPEKLKCSNGQQLSTLTVSGLCSQTSSVVWASLVIALFLGALIGGAFAVYYKFTHEIKAWLFAHNLCLWFVTEEELDKDKLYDAFVSFSQKDEAFIVNELVPNLEGGPIPFKLCLHYRDWVAGEYIPNQITRSVEDSRRTLVVLSPNFVESVWGRMEFRAAHCQALSEGRARVIVVLLGDIGPAENLDPELRAYLNMNTYVKWGDPWFWKKLRYALPHPPKALKGSIGLVNRHSKHMNGITMDDKIELICEPNALPPVTTPPAESNATDPLSIKNALNGKLSSPRKVSIPPHEINGTAAAVG